MNRNPDLVGRIATAIANCPFDRNDTDGLAKRIADSVDGWCEESKVGVEIPASKARRLADMVLSMGSVIAAMESYEGMQFHNPDLRDAGLLAQEILETYENNDPSGFG